jgi:hypothetical protein
MTAGTMGPAELPDAVAAELASDLVAIVGHLAALPGMAGQPTGERLGWPGVSGVVKVRLSGDRAGIDAVAAVLAGACEVLDRSGPRRNHQDPGERVYLTIGTGPGRPAGPAHRT